MEDDGVVAEYSYFGEPFLHITYPPGQKPYRFSNDEVGNLIKKLTEHYRLDREIDEKIQEKKGTSRELCNQLSGATSVYFPKLNQRLVIASELDADLNMIENAAGPEPSITLNSFFIRGVQVTYLVASEFGDKPLRQRLEEIQDGVQKRGGEQIGSPVLVHKVKDLGRLIEYFEQINRVFPYRALKRIIKSLRWIAQPKVRP